MKVINGYKYILLFVFINEINKDEKFMEKRILDRTKFEYYWSYYLSIEKMLKDTSRFVASSYENKNTYSDEFAKIILLSCSEIDSILKIICKLKGVEKKDNEYNMKIYVQVLSEIEDIKEIAYSPYPSTYIDERSLIVFPFKEIDKNKKYGGLSWWNTYQALKHNRLESAEKGNLYNAVSAVAAHYILMRTLIEFLYDYDGKEYVKEHNLSEYFIPCV